MAVKPTLKRAWSKIFRKASRSPSLDESEADLRLGVGSDASGMSELGKRKKCEVESVSKLGARVLETETFESSLESTVKRLKKSIAIPCASLPTPGSVEEKF